MIRKKKLNMMQRMLAIIVIFVVGILTNLPLQADAMTTGQEQDYWLLDSIVGRYNLNYTGNTNAFSKAMAGIDQVYTDVPNWGNSSSATLTKTNGASSIRHAFLVWEVFDGASNPTNSVYMKTPVGRYYEVAPNYVVNDWRTAADNPPSWAYKTMYCMAADVTSYVQDAGYGTYSVCNIPYKASSGGESSASWQLVVVEEGENFPVRVVSLSMGARFKMGTTPSSTNGGNFSSVIPLNNGLKSKSSGVATGQIIFGASNADVERRMPMTSYMTTYNGGDALRTVSANTTYQAALYRNGAVMNDRDYLNGGCIRVDLSDISDIGNNANSLKLEVRQDSWTTFFMLGYSMDIAFPDFIANQTTTVNSSESVTVKGDIKNVSTQANTGIYDGELVVNIDPGLTVKSATAIVDGNKSITGVVLGNTVTFSGEAIKNIMKGNTITYTVECTPNGTGTGRYDNSDSFSGKLRADGVDTRYWINDACTSSSYALAKYKVTVNKGTGIKNVSGGGEYTYGQKVTINAEVLPGYHWKDWTGDLNTQIQKYSFDMPAKDITVTANAEANTYTIHFDPNDGTEVTPIPDMTVRYDEEFTLPDAADVYIRYTLDGVNVTQNILDGTIVLDENGAVMMMLDEETGTMTTPDGATVSEDGIITKTNADGSTTVTYPDGNVVTVSPEGVKTEIGEDGSKKVTYPDGNVVRVNPDGTTVPSDGAVPEATGTTGVTGADESTDGTRTGTAGDDAGSSESTETTENTETTESTEKTASVERNTVSRVATAADGTGGGTDAGTNAADVTSAQADLVDEMDAEPQPDKKAYASVFLGWSSEEEKDVYGAQWQAGETLKVSELMDYLGLTDTNGATATLYAAWDDCPWIVAENLYYTLTQAQSGFITQDEILSHATAYDREDGSPIAPGVHEDGTSFTIPDYSPTDFTQFQHEGSCTENLTVVDSVGNTYWKQITVYIVDTTPVAVKPEGTTRFINEYYYNQPYENGGLEDNSIWKTDPEYAAVLQQAFDNLKNDTPEETYYFTHEEILEMKQFIDENGFGNTQSEDALNRFYDQFMAPNLE